MKILFASASQDVVEGAIERMRDLLPELELYVVSEFPPPSGRWIPYHFEQRWRDNLARCRAALAGKRVRISAAILEPNTPYWRMRAMAFALSPRYFLAFNEHLGHFMLRPRSLPVMARHTMWRGRNFVNWQLSPRGAMHTFFRQMLRPRDIRRLFYYGAARAAGHLPGLGKLAAMKVRFEGRRQAGVSVVIPSRDGLGLLESMLPAVFSQLGEDSEVIVVDNGSSDDTAGFLARKYRQVHLLRYAEPLSFARAVNAGIAAARFSHVCLLNNDMLIEAGLFEELQKAFDSVPGLFCATAQIFFPGGKRREETGKAAMPLVRRPGDFPVRYEPPLEGEDQSYVLYGSGGCSLYDAAKLRALGGFDEIYRPAYAEDLDIGVRAWQQGWPSVFVSGARVLHQHRATTSRFFTGSELSLALEINYLRFLRRTAPPSIFRREWPAAVKRLNLLCAETPTPGSVDPYLAALREASTIPLTVRRRAADEKVTSDALAIASGDVFVFPGRAASGRPVVAVVSPYLPFPLSHGGAVRIYNLMRRAAPSYDLVLIAFTGDPSPPAEELRDLCVEIVLVHRRGSHIRRSNTRPDTVEEFDCPAFHAALRQTVRKWQPGVAQLEFTQMAQYAEDCLPAQTVLVEHDITFDLYAQLLEGQEDWDTRRQYERWLQFEREAWSRVGRVVTVSEKDRAEAPGAVCLPNGVDIQRFRPSDEEPEPRRLLFVGSFAHLPNLLALEFFLRECWPALVRNGATLHVIAGQRAAYYADLHRDRVQADIRAAGVVLEEFVADVRPAYRRAAIVIAPLLASAGTNIKIMEAMAMGKAIVSTRGGIHGLDLTPGHDVLIASDGASFTAAIEQLFADPERRRLLGRNARATAECRFDWDTIAREQDRLYEELFDGGTRSDARVHVA